MRNVTLRLNLLIAIIVLASSIGMAQMAAAGNSKIVNETDLKTFVIEREIAGAGKLTADELKSISQTSCSVIKEIGPRIQWIHSYVTGNKIYCIYKSTNIELIREHAKKGGFPANSISEVATVISPATAN